MLYRATKITNFEALYKTIVEQSYTSGREQGKNDAYWFYNEKPYKNYFRS
jgi:hypothetical protein